MWHENDSMLDFTASVIHTDHLFRIAEQFSVKQFFIHFRLGSLVVAHNNPYLFIVVYKLNRRNIKIAISCCMWCSLLLVQFLGNWYVIDISYFELLKYEAFGSELSFFLWRLGYKSHFTSEKKVSFVSCSPFYMLITKLQYWLVCLTMYSPWESCVRECSIQYLPFLPIATSVPFYSPPLMSIESLTCFYRTTYTVCISNNSCPLVAH